MGKKILFSGFRDERHSYFGGYDWIAKYPESEYLNSESIFLGKLKTSNKWKIVNLFLLDMKTRFKMRKYDVVHYFYGDLTIFMPFKKNRKTRIITTIHLNQSVPYRVNIYKSLKTCDTVITLSSYQRDYFRNQYGLNTCFIPHGFNKPKWSDLIPLDKRSKRINKSKTNVICIGKQYRDNDLLIQIVKKYADENINFHIVGNKNVHNALENNENIYLYNFLSDDEYYSLMSECDYSFMPLTFSTANNTLLEAQSIGLISILPKITGIEDYASKENTFYSNLEDLEKIFKSIKKRDKSQSLIDYSKKFEWSNIYKELEKIYNN